MTLLVRTVEMTGIGKILAIFFAWSANWSILTL